MSNIILESLINCFLSQFYDLKEDTFCNIAALLVFSRRFLNCELPPKIITRQLLVCDEDDGEQGAYSLESKHLQFLVCHSETAQFTQRLKMPPTRQDIICKALSATRYSRRSLKEIRFASDYINKISNGLRSFLEDYCEILEILDARFGDEPFAPSFWSNICTRFSTTLVKLHLSFSANYSNFSISGTLRHLRNLEYLHLECLRKMTDTEFADEVSHLRRLKVLKLENLSGLTGTSFQRAFERHGETIFEIYFKDLRNLIDVSGLSCLVNLRKLDITRCEKLKLEHSRKQPIRIQRSSENSSDDHDDGPIGTTTTTEVAEKEPDSSHHTCGGGGGTKYWSFPLLEHFSCQGIRIGNHSLDFLKTCPGLKHFINDVDPVNDSRRNHADGDFDDDEASCLAESLEALCNCTEIEFLSFADSSLSESNRHLGYFKHIRALKHLNLHSAANILAGALALVPNFCHSLKDFYTYQLKVDCTTLEALAKMQVLEILDLSGATFISWEDDDEEEEETNQQDPDGFDEAITTRTTPAFFLTGPSKTLRQVWLFNPENLTRVDWLAPSAANVEDLHIDWSPELKRFGATMKNLKKLVTLAMPKIEELEEDLLIEVLRNNKDLESINVNGNRKIGDQFLEAVANFCPRMQGMSLNHCSGITTAAINEHLSKLPRLNMIAIEGTNVQPEDIFPHLTEKQRNRISIF